MLSARRCYRAAVLENINEPLKIVNHKKCSPHDGELLLDVGCAGFNYSDVQMIDGTYHLKPKTPFVPGFEVAGTVVEVGKGLSRFKEGDRVMALKTEGCGAFAEQCTLSEADLIFPIPYSMDFETAASIAVSYGTAYVALRKMALEHQGSSVLVLSSRGTIGFAAIDLAQNVFKAQVFAASDSEEKLEKLRSSGVQSTFNWTKGNMARDLKKLTFGKGVDLVIDTVGGQPFYEALNSLKTGGSIMSLGFSSGTIPSLNLLDLHRLQASVSGVWLGGRPFDEIEEVMKNVIALFDEGYLNTRVAQKYKLEEINDCIKDVKEDKVYGKTIILVR